MGKKSQSWLQAQQHDPYVKQATKAGYRCRAVYKLAQIDARDQLFHPHMTVVDLGAAPGGWCQWVKQRLNDRVQLVAVDKLAMLPIAGVTFIQGDFQHQTVVEQLLEALPQQQADLVMSDMAPNMSGIKAVDQPRSMLLAELARDLAIDILKARGHFLVKLFQGEGFDSYLTELRAYFKQVVVRKPEASRAHSREVYILAKYRKIN